MLRLYFCTLLCSLALWSPFAAPAQTPVVSSPPAPLPEVQKLLDKGDQEGNAYHWQQALDAYQQALEKARSVQDKAGEARTLRNIGAVYINTGQPTKALDYLQQALPLYRAIADKSGEANTLNRIGIACDETSQPAKALEFYQQALSLAGDIGDKAGEAKPLMNMGGIYFATGQPTKALEAFERALPLFRAVGSKEGEAKTLGSIGIVYIKTSQPTKGLGYFQQALPLCHAIGDKQGEAQTLGNIGIVYNITGRTTKAIAAHQQALPLFRAIGDKQGEAASLVNIGAVYYGTGQPAKTLDAYQQALPLYRAIGAKVGEARTLGNIGTVYDKTGQRAKALEFLQQALRGLRAADAKSEAAHMLLNTGSVYADMDQPAKALKCCQQALAECRAVGDKSSEAEALKNIGIAYINAGRFAKARESLQQGLALNRAIGDKQGEAKTLTDIGILYARQNHPAEAESAFRQATALLKTLRHNLGGLSEAKIAFTENNIDTYAYYLDALVRQQRAAEGFVLAQQTKSRTLLDLLENGRASLTSRLSEEESTQLTDLRARPSALNREMIAERVRNRAGAKQRLTALQEQLRQAERDLSAFTDTLYVRHPDVAQARGVHTLTVREAARMLPPDTALLEYATRQDAGHAAGKTSLVLFVVTPDGKVSVHTVPVSAKRLQTLAAAFHRACANPDAEYQAQAKALYRLLLAPAEARLSGKKHLLICPDGPLWNVSFAALQDSKGRFVAETHSLTFAYSATGVAAALSKRAQPHASGSVLAFANPDFGDATRFSDGLRLPEQRPVARPSEPVARPGRPPGSVSRNLVAQLRGGGIKALPGTQAEADALHRLYPDAAIYTGVNAQEATFKRGAGQYRYVHLASHALFNDAAPLLSSVFLAAPPKSGAGSEEDGFLTARELFDLKLNAELVTLSACQTGQGESHSGEGIIGMTWALTVAGVPTQVVSQWSVDDGATADLMSGFYARLKAGQGKGAALQAAAQAIRADPQRRHPFYWAPFILMGDWR